MKLHRSPPRKPQQHLGQPGGLCALLGGGLAQGNGLRPWWSVLNPVTKLLCSPQPSMEQRCPVLNAGLNLSYRGVKRSQPIHHRLVWVSESFYSEGALTAADSALPDWLPSLMPPTQQSPAPTDFCFSFLLLHLLISSILFPSFPPWPWRFYIPCPQLSIPPSCMSS